LPFATTTNAKVFANRFHGYVKFMKMNRLALVMGFAFFKCLYIHHIARYDIRINTTAIGTFATETPFAPASRTFI
jgi:hypothetical protein